MVVLSPTATDADEARIDQLFHALSDRTRRDILRRALESEYSVSALASTYAMSFAAVQKHVAVLERAGLVAKRRSGRERHVRSEIEAIHTAQLLLDGLETEWRRRIDRFTDVLSTTEGAP